MTTPLTRRVALGALATGSAAVLARPAMGARAPGLASGAFGLSAAALGYQAATGEYTLPDLPYDAGALEPHIDAQTMTIHHDRHHAGYVRGLNIALQQLELIRTGGGDPALIKHWCGQLSFNASGHINHTLFWNGMAPDGPGEPSGPLMDAIVRDFGSFNFFKAQFTLAAETVEGGGWAWLIHEPMGGRLMIIQQEKQQNMFVTGARPLLGIDVWEHAYYLKYQNRRAEYVAAFMNVINWPFVQGLYESAAR
ncbi:MAG: superoxide dismutase [Phycisphaerales bacterium]